jgi:hypothetical protein
MEILQNSFIYNTYISHIDIVHWKHIWHMVINTFIRVSNVLSMYDIHM